MRLLLVGKDTASVALLQSAFAGSTPAVTRCTDSTQAIAELHRSGWKYDWVILESREALKREGKIISAVKALGLPVPVGFLDAARGSKPALSLVCAAQKSADGLQFLQCALSRPGAVKIDYRTHPGEEMYLEYQAPSKKEGLPSTPVLIIQSPATGPPIYKLNCA